MRRKALLPDFEPVLAYRHLEPEPFPDFETASDADVARWFAAATVQAGDALGLPILATHGADGVRIQAPDLRGAARRATVETATIRAVCAQRRACAFPATLTAIVGVYARENIAGVARAVLWAAMLKGAIASTSYDTVEIEIENTRSGSSLAQAYIVSREDRRWIGIPFKVYGDGVSVGEIVTDALRCATLGRAFPEDHDPASLDFLGGAPL